MAVERSDPPFVADERAMLEAWLEYHRATLAVKCDGVPPERLAERTVPPSSMSLLGLVRHMADVERGWFRRGLGGQDAGPIYYSEDNPEGDFEDVDAADAAADLATWRAECEAARAVSASRSLDDTFDNGGEPVSHRWVVLHMVEEYARHNGHADLIRERLDGATGE